MRKRVLWLFGVLALSGAALATTLSIPHTFENDSDADADQVNANFTAITTWADGNVGTGNIASGVVTSAMITNNTIVNADIAPAAAIEPTKIAWPAPTPGAGVTVGNVGYLDGYSADDIIGGGTVIAAGVATLGAWSTATTATAHATATVSSLGAADTDYAVILTPLDGIVHDQTEAEHAVGFAVTSQTADSFVIVAFSGHTDAGYYAIADDGDGTYSISTDTTASGMKVMYVVVSY